jgi:phosphohistidine phosphatase SixA
LVTREKANAVDGPATVQDETSDRGDSPKGQLIVFLRHGIAEERTDSKPDEERSLTAKGHARMKDGARGLRKLVPKAQAIYSSPLLRAVQTALWVSRAYRNRLEIHTTDALLPEASDEVMTAFIESLSESRAVLVGHEPSMSSGMMALAEVFGQPLVLKKGGACAFRIGAGGERSLEWLLSPRLLRRLSRS